MRYNIKGKNMEIGDRTREKVSAKLDRVKKLFPEDSEAVVLIKSEKLEYVVEVTIPMAKRVVRAEVSASYNAPETATDPLPLAAVPTTTRRRLAKRCPMSYDCANRASSPTETV